MKGKRKDIRETAGKKKPPAQAPARGKDGKFTKQPAPGSAPAPATTSQHPPKPRKPASPTSIPDSGNIPKTSIQDSTPDSGGYDPTKPIGPFNPPRSSQFRPGTSGNPAGRKLGTKNTTTVIRYFLDMEEQVVNPITKETEILCQLDIMTLGLIKKARNGDVAAFNALLDRIEGKPKQTTAFENPDGADNFFLVGFGKKTTPPAEEGKA